VGIGSFRVGSLVHESVHGCTVCVEFQYCLVSLQQVEVNVLGVYKRD
jgi:hypothetical protein